MENTEETGVTPEEGGNDKGKTLHQLNMMMSGYFDTLDPEKQRSIRYWVEKLNKKYKVETLEKGTGLFESYIKDFKNLHEKVMEFVNLINEKGIEATEKLSEIDIETYVRSYMMYSYLNIIRLHMMMKSKLEGNGGDTKNEKKKGPGSEVNGTSDEGNKE